MRQAFRYEIRSLEECVEFGRIRAVAAFLNVARLATQQQQAGYHAANIIQFDLSDRFSPALPFA